MPIAVGCQCGQRFAAPDHLAGKQVKCPKCGSALNIPAPQQQPAAAAPQQAAAPRPASPPMPAGPGPRDLFAEAGFVAPTPGMSTCPVCQAPMHQQAVLCVKCGFDRRVGKQVQGVAMSAPAAHGGHGDVSSVLLARAAKTIDEDKAEEAKTRAQGLPAWAYAGLLVVLAIFTAYTMRYGVGGSFVGVGTFIYFLILIAQVYYGVKLAIAIFEDSPLQLLLYLFCPFYWIYYLIKNWDRVGKFFLMQLYWSLLAIVAALIVMLGQVIIEASKATGGVG